MKKKSSTLDAAWTLGRLGARRLLRRREGARDLELGELLTGQLDEMKGLAMKVGQIISYMDVPLPEPVQAQLSRLQSGRVGLSRQETCSALASALGPEFEALFDELDLQPIAAASIGQVHRAVFAGQRVALKLRYPAVLESFRKDLGAIGKVASLASLASAVDGHALVRELGERLAEECDYRREAAFQSAFRRAFESEPGIVVPEVHARLTTPTTLGTTWVDGLDFSAACRQPPEVRNAHATRLVRFSYRSLLGLAAIQADPHPGNYVFGADGSVAFLDFGCVRRFERELVQRLRALLTALDRGDRPAFRGLTIELGMAPRPERFDFDHHFRTMAHLHRPLLSRRFEFSRDYVRRGYELNGPTSPNARHLGFPSEQIWVARLQWGLWSLLARLEASVELRSVLDDVLAEPVAPLPPIALEAAH